MGNCHRNKTTVDQGKAKFDNGFLNNPSQVNVCACTSYSVYILYIFCIYSISKAQVTPVRIYGEPKAHKIWAIYNFWNITRHQAISPVAKSHHVLECGLLIQLVILIFILCFSANQNHDYFTWKYNIHVYKYCYTIWEFMA